MVAYPGTEAGEVSRSMESTTDTADGTEERYASIETVDGDLVIYDDEQPTAWLQSNHAVEIEA